MPDFNFTSAQVETKAGRKPWTRQREFAAEIQPDDMADTAAVYARAAGEASGAGELARHATEVGADAGGLDGASLVDEDGRIDATARGLQGNGQDMDSVVDYLVRSMNRAIQADEEVFDLVLGDGGLEEARTRHITAAVNEWNGWQSALEAAVPANPLGDSSVLRPIMSIDVSYGGRTLTIAPEQDWSRSVYSLPASLATEIREKHLGNAADDAVTADDEITDAIEAYRNKLAEYGVELGALGYDLSDGPLGLWTTDEMATYAGQRLSEELAKDHPDPEALLRWTEGLDSVARGIYDNPDDPEEAAKDLTPAERAYLQTFLGELDADELARLGHLTEDTAGLDPGQAGIQFASVQRVANGINMLTNPEIGGLDPTTEAGRAALPAGVRHFVYEAREDFVDGFANAAVRRPVGDEFKDALRDFNGFGALMSTGSIAPGDGFGTGLASAAVDIQSMTEYQYFDGGHEDVANTGSSGLLRNVSLNDGLSADLLNDTSFREAALGLHWEDSTGIAEVVRAGTTIPDGVDGNSTAARPYVQAAFNVLDYAAGHNDEILGRGNPNIAEYAPLDHSALQDAVGDTMLTYMDMLSKGSAETEFSAPADPNAADRFTDRNLHGRDYLYSFEFDGDDRRSLFSLMNKTDESVRQDFFNGVGAWQEVTAYNAFLRDEPGGRSEQSSTFEDIGRVAGTVQYVQKVEEASDTSKQQFTSYGAIATGASVINTLADAGRVNAVTSIAGFALTEGLRYSLPDGAEERKQAQWDAVNFGDNTVRAIVADAAIKADYHGASDYRLPDTSSPNVDQDDLRRATLDVEGAVYDAYRDALVEGYNDAVYNDATAN